jgi:hypothetical protein
MGLSRSATQAWSESEDIPKVHLHVLERTLSDASTAITSWLHSVAVMLDFLTLATHASLTAIEDGRRLGRAPAPPVPVWLCAVVRAFNLECMFVRPGEVSVPGKEVACSVDTQSILHVNCDEVVISGLCARVL